MNQQKPVNGYTTNQQQEALKMAVPVHLFLTDDGGAMIRGSSDVADREGSIESHHRSVMSFLLPSDFSFLRPAAIPIANDDSLLNERARVIALLPFI